MSERKNTTVMVLKNSADLLDHYWNNIEARFKHENKPINFTKSDVATDVIRSFFIHMSKNDIRLDLKEIKLPPQPPFITIEQFQKLDPFDNGVGVDESIVKDFNEQLLPQLEKLFPEEGEYVLPELELMFSHSLYYMLNYNMQKGIYPNPTSPLLEEQEVDDKSQ